MKLNDPALFRQECYINGGWQGSDKTFEVFDPADQSVIARVPSFGRSETAQAIACAQAAWGALAWSAGKRAFHTETLV